MGSINISGLLKNNYKFSFFTGKNENDVRRRLFLFFRVFQDLCEFVIHCNKRHIFLCLFVFLLTITDRDEAIIVEIIELVVLNGIIPGVLIIRFLAITKNDASSRL